MFSLARRAAAFADRCPAASVRTRWPEAATDRVASVATSRAFRERPDFDAFVRVAGRFPTNPDEAFVGREDFVLRDDFRGVVAATFASTVTFGSRIARSRSSKRRSAPSNNSAFSRLRTLLAAVATGLPKAPFTAPPRERFVERFCRVNLSSHLSRRSLALRIAVRSIFSVAFSTEEPKLDSRKVRSASVSSDRTDADTDESEPSTDWRVENDARVDFAMIVFSRPKEAAGPGVRSDKPLNRPSSSRSALPLQAVSRVNTRIDANRGRPPETDSRKRR